VEGRLAVLAVLVLFVVRSMRASRICARRIVSSGGRMQELGGNVPCL